MSTDPGGPLDDLDAAILDQLHAAYAQLDPPPPSLAEQVCFALELENIDVEAYGSNMKLKQLALITTPEPRLLVIQPFDASVTKDIEKAIRSSEF